jgi:thioester reductase-like protein
MRLLILCLVALLSSCMLPSRQETLDTQASQVQATREKLTRLSNQIKALCTNPEYSAYFAKTFCTPNDANIAMMSDKSKINNSEKIALNAWAQAYDNLAAEMSAVLHAGSPQNKQMALYTDNVAIPAAQKIRRELYEGKITWGQFNLGRKQIFDGILAETRRVHP